MIDTVATSSNQIVSMFDLWFLFSLDSIKQFLTSEGVLTFTSLGLSLFTLALFVIRFIYMADESEVSKTLADFCKNNIMKFLKITVFLILFVNFLTFVGKILPTTKQMAAIIVIPKIINNEKIQQIPEKFLDLGNSYLDEWIDEFNKRKEEKKEQLEKNKKD